jgi:hypothetical protein
MIVNSESMTFDPVIFAFFRGNPFPHILGGADDAIWPSTTLAKMSQKSSVTSESLHRG